MASAYDVDVIILSLNRINETLEAIDSACAQQGLAVAVHVVDQGSLPEKLARLRAHIEGRPHIFLTALDTNLGVPGGRNMASRSGTAPFIVALDNDAEFATPDTLARAVAALSREPKLGAIGFRILNFTTGADDVTSWGYPDLHWQRRHLEFPTTNFVGAGHAIRRQAFEEAGGYDDRLFFIGEELELGLKLLNLGYEIRYVGSIAVRHKVTAEARIGWDRGRQFYTMRNRVYLSLKSGDSPTRLAQSAMGLLLKGARKGCLIETLRGLFAGFALYLSLPAALRKDGPSRLKPETVELVDRLNYRHFYSFWDRFRNAWASGSETARGVSRSRTLR